MDTPSIKTEHDEMEERLGQKAVVVMIAAIGILVTAVYTDSKWKDEDRMAINNCIKKVKFDACGCIPDGVFDNIKSCAEEKVGRGRITKREIWQEIHKIPDLDCKAAKKSNESRKIPR